MIKAHSPINWENEPSFNTPINETNLNKMDSTIGILDDRIIEQETSKLDKATAYTMVKDISFNENNGVFTVTRLNGSTFTIDTKLEKISINFDYNAETQQIEIILIDGTKQYIDISSLISPIDFVDSDTIGWEVTSDWKVKSKVLDGSITEDMLQPNYLAEIKVETEKSAQSMANAKISENNAKQSELNAKASEEQALEYSNNAQPLAQSVSGNNPTATNSADASLIYLNNKGYTNQEKPVFDGLVTTTTNGIKNTNPIPCNNGDVIKVVTGVETGQIVVSTFSGESIPFQGVGVPGYFLEFTLDTDTGGGIFIEIYKANDTPTFKEVKVNGSAYVTPTPDAPIRIGASADKGYFDGVLDIKSVGSLTDAISNKNPFTCKAGDVIKVMYEDVVDNFSMRLIDTDGQAWDYNLSNVDEMEWTMPLDAQEVYFYIKDDTISSVADAKHICVTINGMYAVRVKTQNKNLLDATLNTTIGSNNQYIFDVKPNTSYTLSLTQKCVAFDDANPKAQHWYRFYDENGQITSQNAICLMTFSKVDETLTRKQTIKTSEQVRSVRIDLGTYTQSALRLQTIEAQFEEGEVATPYEPHQETTALIPVSAPLYDGDYIEVYADGTGREYRENYSSLLPKSGWTVTDETNSKQATIYSTNTSAVFGEPRQELTSTHFGNTDTNKIVYYRGSFWVKFPSEYTNEEITNVFANNDIVFVGKRATPTSTPLTQEQVAEFRKLQTFNGVTHVTADGDVVMRYYCDNASGETVEMLHNMTTNIFMTSSHTYESTESEEVNVGQKLEIDIPIDSIDGYTPLAVIGFNVNDIGVGSVRFNDSKTSVLIDGKVLTKINQSTGELQSTISTKTKATATVLWVKNILIKNGMP